MADESPTPLEELVEERRLELRIKKQELAARAAVHPSHLRKVLVGKASLTPDLSAALDHALEWPRGELNRRLGPRANEHAPPDVELDELIAAALRERERIDHALAELQREKQRRTAG